MSIGAATTDHEKETLIESIKDTFTVSKAFTSLCTHASLAVATGGYSLPVTLGLSGISYFGRMSPHEYDKRNGWTLERREVAQNVLNADKPFKVAALEGVKSSLKQTASRPFTLPALLLGSLCDSVSSLSRYVSKFSQSADEAIESKAGFSMYYTLSDAFTRKGLTCPSGETRDHYKSRSAISMPKNKL